MLSLSHTAGYAVLAMACIGSCGGQWVRTDQIHRCTGVPKPYLRKLLNSLAKAGLISTKRGYQGGFVLARSPEEVSLMEVIAAVEPGATESNCLLGLAGCSDANPCPMRHFWNKHRPKIEAELARTTLDDAAKYVKGSNGMLTACGCGGEGK